MPSETIETGAVVTDGSVFVSVDTATVAATSRMGAPRSTEPVAKASVYLACNS